MRLSDDLEAFLLNYLSNRTVVLKVNDARSQPLTLRAWTPQGATLSLTLFNFWISDIPPKSGTHTSQFAIDIAKLLETARQVCFSVDVPVRRAAVCMYGLSSRYTEFAVDLFEPAILPE